jgi:hypothetical protein
MQHEKILPDMSHNIVCGNSLVDYDILGQNLFSENKERKLNPMSFKNSFREIMQSNGFDAIVGNPPYVQTKTLDPQSQEYLAQKFSTGTDLYALFMEQSLKLLKPNGLLGYIVPSLFLKGIKYEGLRDFINTNCSAMSIDERGDNVFENVKMPTCIVVFTKGKPQSATNYFINVHQNMFQKVPTQKLSDIANIKRGLEIGQDKLLLKGKYICLTGKSIDSYLVKELLFIDGATYKDFAKDAETFTSPKIMVRETGNKFFATIDYENLLTTRSIYNVKITDKTTPAECVLGVINSTLFQFYFQQFVIPETSIFPKIRIAQLKELPLPARWDNKKELEQKVKPALSAMQKIYEATNDNDKRYYTAKYNAIRQEIDHIVYELYGLSPADIAIVENNI